MKTTTLFDQWKGMAPDNPRDRMSANQVWLMKDFLPRVLGSQLESRNDWRYSTHGPLNGPVAAQIWISTLGLLHHLVVTPSTLYGLDTPESPSNIVATPGAGNPMASMNELVGIPCGKANLPKFVKFVSGGGSTPTILTTEGTTPKAEHMLTWNGYFVVANYTDATGTFPSRVGWLGDLEGNFTLTGTTTPAFDTRAWMDTSNDVTALGRTRTAILAFHADHVERLRGGVPPGTNRLEGDLWVEPLIGLGGCTEPHTVCYWNDNVLFCDGRGAYLTDGTTIKDVTAQGGISRVWRRRYTTNLKLAGGIYADFWVISATDKNTGAFVDCWVCDLYSRQWVLFSNIPCTSFVTATDMGERLYGGTFDGKIINLTRMWDEADLTADTVDENGAAVLPSIETAWLKMSSDTSMKRVRELRFDFALDEVGGAINVSSSKAINPLPADWTALATLRAADVPPSNGYRRRKIELGQEHYGFTFKFETTGAVRNLKLYDFSAEGPNARETGYTG